MDLKEVIDDAIISEEKSYQFYLEMAKKAKTTSSKILFETLADEELTHKKSLIDFGSDFEFLGTSKDFNLLENLMLTPLDEMGKLISNLKSAVKKEDAANKGYELLSKKTNNPKAKRLFENLAREELRHNNMIKNEITRLK